jgi:hypothetical protein
MVEPVRTGLLFFLATGFLAGFGWAARAGLTAGLAAFLRREAAVLRTLGFAWDLVAVGFAAAATAAFGFAAASAAGFGASAAAGFVAVSVAGFDAWAASGFAAVGDSVLAVSVGFEVAV